MNALERSATGEPASVIASLPAITIAAFCQTEGMAAVMRTAAADRRLSRASCTIEPGGVAGAVQAFQGTVTPHVLIVECAVKPSEMLDALRPLAEVCDPSTLVVVVGHVNDVVLYRDLTRSGVAEYLVAPLHPLQIIDALAGLFRDPGHQPSGRIIAFTGAKGGVGSSTIAHNIAWLFAHRAKINTVVTDLDLAFGTSALNFNQDIAAGVADAAAQADRLDPAFLDRLFTRYSDHLSLLSGTAALDQEGLLNETTVDAVLESLRQSAPNIIVDMPSAWTGWSRHTLINADDVIITATPELAAARNTRNILELLRQSRQNDRPPCVVLNQTGVLKRPELTAADFKTIIGVEPAVVINYDPVNFGTAATTGKILCAMAPASKGATQIAGLFTHLTKSRSAQPAATNTGDKSSLIGMLQGMLSGKK